MRVSVDGIMQHDKTISFVNNYGERESDWQPKKHGKGLINAITSPKWTHLDQDTDPFGESFSEVAARQPGIWHGYCFRQPKNIKYNKSKYIEGNLNKQGSCQPARGSAPGHQSKENGWVQLLSLGGSSFIRW